MPVIDRKLGVLDGKTKIVFADDFEIDHRRIDFAAMKRLMLDIHALLWAIGKSDALPPQTIEYIKDGKNDVFVSAVSLWEIASNTIWASCP
ncbi:MAG: hypothetical protein LBB62_05720 [Proteiniphilum sp.]|jgi:hypothetical protein|nr:hypothetical protein [Proteiniphilum sp.]